MTSNVMAYAPDVSVSSLLPPPQEGLYLYWAVEHLKLVSSPHIQLGGLRDLRPVRLCPLDQCIWFILCYSVGSDVESLHGVNRIRYFSFPFRQGSPP